MKTISPEVRSYLSRIGRKGAKAGASKGGSVSSEAKREAKRKYWAEVREGKRVGPRHNKNKQVKGSKNENNNPKKN